MNTPRKNAFVLVSTTHGTLIVNRYDYAQNAYGTYGVGVNLLERSEYEPEEINTGKLLLSLRRKYFGDGVVALDCGANIGVNAVEWSNAMRGWGTLTAIEAQARVFYALAGNLALNNCENADAIHAAISDSVGSMAIPVADHLQPGSFGSLELKRRADTEYIGQAVDYSKTVNVRTITVDSLALPRLDFLKIDVEAMELEVLTGARETIARCKPVILVEVLKVSQEQLRSVLAPFGYLFFPLGMNLLAIHESDKTASHVTANTPAEAVAQAQAAA